MVFNQDGTRADGWTDGRILRKRRAERRQAQLRRRQVLIAILGFLLGVVFSQAVAGALL